MKSNASRRQTARRDARAMASALDAESRDARARERTENRFRAEDPCANAAENERLKCLKYAHEHGCPCDELTCSSASENGQLECLKYAHEHGCPWDERTCSAAKESEEWACFGYARANGCPEYGPGHGVPDENANGTHKDSGAAREEIVKVMSLIDEHAKKLPEGAYIDVCTSLKRAHDQI